MTCLFISLHSKSNALRKLQILSFFSLFTLIFSPTYGQSWLWGRDGNATSIGWSDNYSIATDRHGNVYTAGVLGDSSIFGNDTLAGPIPSGSIMVVKYDANGNVKWGRTSVNSGSPYEGVGQSCITADLDGNVYVCGGFDDTLYFGSQRLISDLNINAYLVKYDSIGNFIWAKQTTTYSNLANARPGYTMVADKDGNIYLSGTLVDTVYFSGTVYLVGKSYGDAFLVKYDPNGDIIWARQSTNKEYGVSSSGVAIDDSAHIYMAARAYDSCHFGNFLLARSSAILVKYDSAGNVLWAVEAQSPYCQFGSITSNAKGEIYVLGGLGDTAIFASDTLLNLQPLRFHSNGELFIAKYTTTGNPIFGKEITILDTDIWSPNSISADSSNHIYLSFRQESSYEHPNTYAEVEFDNDTFALSSVSFAAIFMQLDTMAHLSGGSLVPVNWANNITSVTTDVTGQYVYFDAELGSECVFGPDTVGPVIPNYTQYAFVARWQQVNSVTTSGNSITAKNGVSLFPNPNNGKFTIQSSVISGQSSVEIYNVFGEKVFTSTLPQTPKGALNEINLASQPSGIYLYIVIKQDGELLGEGKVIIAK